MCLCIEAIEWKDGAPQRLAYHQQRVDAAFKALYPDASVLSLADVLGPGAVSTDSGAPLPDKGLYKLRLLFDTQVRLLECQPYAMRPIQSLQLVEIDHEPMVYKSGDRAFIDEAVQKKGQCDDVLMVCNGLLTDTSYANIAVLDGLKWLSPHIPLLYGTRRAYLLDHQLIELADIRMDELHRFQRIRLFNAMIGFGELELPMSRILFP